MKFCSLFLRMLRPLGLISALLATSACGTLDQAKPEGGPSTEIAPDDPAIRYSGRIEGVEEGSEAVTFGYSGARIRLRFEGPAIAAQIEDERGENYAMVWIDGEAGAKFRLDAPDGIYPLASGLAPGAHTVEVVRVTECFLGLTEFRGFVLPEGGKALPWGENNGRRIEFIGDSITCGYGVEVDDPQMHFDPTTENFCLGYSGLTARALEADYLVVSRSGIGMLRNYDGPYDGSEETMPTVYPHTFYGHPESDWDFARFTPDVVCLNLGTNDFSTTGVNVEKFVAAYVEFASGVLERYPDTQLVILQGPMNNSEALGHALAQVVAQLRTGPATERVHFFALTAQGPVGHGADYHPNRAQSRINTAELTAFLRDLMDWRS